MSARILSAFFVLASSLQGGEVVAVWPGKAPGETDEKRGTHLPLREQDDPPIVRIKDITAPTMEVFAPEDGKGNGAAVLILPGGGFRYVVPNLEGRKPVRS